VKRQSQALLALFLLAASACKKEMSEIETSPSGVGISEWTDPRSGCIYLIATAATNGATAITPRLDRNGRPLCPATPPTTRKD
jgi:hypothetical protein